MDEGLVGDVVGGKAVNGTGGVDSLFGPVMEESTTRLLDSPLCRGKSGMQALSGEVVA